ncbi:Ubiquinone/menaquinone biosynthesis C-methylase UbiE [Microbacterium sp. cf046]|uniref:class I SAM-dependent methyltransferase n=1 Tax=Microbacterium sp. cf046 TaxID=1761803 RepID=UPI0008EC65B7|nr:class I SAM-dependent methyltransferase [Microbacterium sp. cf046]SFS17688.1 Ubiquinone/menaquinone biosynthesis C-methylase UbiE [Microbacterium sp. cf046]
MSFNVAATAYDRFMGRFSGPLSVGFADWLDVRGGSTALDVGSGPGALTEVLADRLGAASVIAVDPSEPFVAAIRVRLPEVVVFQASAEELPFGDQSFDLAVAQLVVHFMSDPQRGVGELRRVTRTGGVVAVSVWDFEGRRAPQSTFLGALLSVVPDADDEVGRAGAHRGELVSLLEKAGCRDVEETEISVTVTSATFEEWWEPYTLGVGPAGAQLVALDAERQELVRQRCLELLGTGPIGTTATAWAARGIR